MDYKHTATVDPEAGWFRFYCWLWEANPSRTDFCRLFWGLFPPFVIVNLLARAIGWPIVSFGRWVGRKFPTRERLTLAQEIELRDEMRARRKARQRKFDAFFAKVSELSARVNMAVRSAWRYARWPAAALGVLAIAYVGYLTALGAVILWEALGDLTWEIVLISAGAALLTALLVAGVVALAKVGSARRWGPGFSESAKGFGRALRTGAHAVKTNTCPKIELRK